MVLVALVLVVAVATSGQKPAATPDAAAVTPSPEPSVTAVIATPTEAPATEEATPAPTLERSIPAPTDAAQPEVAITGYGATEADWAARHAPDMRFAPGCCYDRTPGLGPDPQHDNKYYGILLDNGRIDVLHKRLPRGTSIAQAKAAALAEFPADGEILWFETLDTCALAELQSATLAEVIGHNGRALVGFDSADAGKPFDPRNVIQLSFFPDDSAELPVGVGC